MNKILLNQSASLGSSDGLQMSRRMFVAGALAVPTIATLTSCGLNSEAGGDGKETAKRTLTIGIGQLAPSTDPRVDASSTSRSSLIHVYDRLITPNNEGGFLPNVATEWEFNDDLTTLTLKLNPAATFSNGEPVDATAVKYSFDSQVDPKNNPALIGTFSSVFSKVTIVDDHTVTFHMLAPNITCFSALCFLFLVPPVYAEKAGWGMDGKGIGSGPMRVKSFEPNDHLTLEPNPDYWGDTKVENLDEITWLSIENEGARRTALESGRADIVFPLSPDNWGSLKDNDKFQAYSTLLGQYQALLLGKYVQKSPLNDERVRQAVSYAINTELITSSILLDTTEPTPGQLATPGTAFFNDNVSAYPFDQDKAKQLLADAGYPNGFKIDMESTSGRTPGDDDVCAAIVQMLGEVDITVNWTALPATEWLDKFRNATGAPLYFMNISMEPSMMPEYCIGLWTTGSFTKVMSDPDYDALVAKTLSTKDDAKRAKLVQDCLSFLHDAAPAAWLYQIPMLYGLAADVKNFVGNPDMSQDLTKVTFA
ncbi:MAG: ABC transporter substrate-binding protein [Nocardioides sp.]|uniref:ABC transporter substrate-binding protein n=1 Tax=Nocardioides sp. TaxID=35761 RepID=UPI0039E524CE